MAIGVGESIATPNLMGNRRFRSYLTQSRATTGKPVSQEVLDEIMQISLDAQARQQQERSRLVENRRQFNVSQANAAETASANRKAGMIGIGSQALTTAATLHALTLAKPVIDPNTGRVLKEGEKFFDFARRGVGNPLQTTSLQTTPPPTYTTPVPDYMPADYAPVAQSTNVAGSTTLGGTTAPVITGTTLAPGSTMAVKGAADITAAEMVGANVVPVAEGAGAGGGVSWGSVATPIGYIAAAEAAKGLWGGKGIPWDEKTTFQKMTSAPANPLMIANILGAGDSNIFGKGSKELARIEQQALKPIDKVFDFISSLFG